MKTKPLVLTSIFIALYFVLSLITLIRLPQGGSATLCSTLFLVLPGFVFGKKYGVLACLVASIISFFIDPFVVAPVQFLLDYTLSSLAWASGAFVFSNKSKYAIEKYYILGAILSFLFSTISGIVFFGAYAPDGMNSVVYSVLYNGSYALVEAVIVLVILRINLFRNILFDQIKKIAY